MNESADAIVRHDVSRKDAEECALVLTAAGVAVQIHSNGRSSFVTVDRDAMEYALTLLAQYEYENPPTAKESPQPDSSKFAPVSGALISLALIAFFFVTGPRDYSVEWFREGNAASLQIQDGELWRTVTALTLHSNLGHVMGNALIGFLFFAGVCGSIGPGVGLAAIVSAGSLGNLLNAYLRMPHHNSVGASTAVFAAIGILCTLSVGRRRRLGLERKRAWAPIAAGLGILAMLGASESSDLWAHLFGILVGFVIAIPIANRPDLRGRAPVQWLAGMAALALIGGAWWCALR